MPTPEREVQPQSPQAVSMKDLLASCAAASAVSTPPRDEREGGEEADREERPGPPARRDAA
ncbi:hypothetical protein ACFT7S_33645 [Streptomyces sp. NPDC057136]|uniref:hypothetical protein n=1 Tax=Streptomyces sp. NPDC057136 TaxID=3346029 RepID=UPI003630A6C5